MYCRVIVDIAHSNVARPFTYLVPDGLSLISGQRVLVPFASREMEGIVLDFCENTDIEEEKIRSVSCALEDFAAITPPLLSLAKEMADNTSCPLAETLRLMFPAQMRGGRVRIHTERYAQLAVSSNEAAAEEEKSKRGSKRQKILERLLDGGLHSVKELSDLISDPGQALKKLEADGIVAISLIEVGRKPETVYCGSSESEHILTEEQLEAMEQIEPALQSGTGRFLLHGVTGSGKTEVFMTAVEKTLNMGKSAIILVPEISLTPQMVAWFRQRFGSRAAVIHSRLSAGERYDEWRRIRRGEARVVIGARSAIFSPVESLGLVVVDEEHESSYISDRHPRYDAREIAASRCGRENATLILASATPSILSFARALRGDYTLLEMPHRVSLRPLPEVTLTDMREELENGNRSIISVELRKALRACMDEGEQAMLLINRRGYQSFVSCRECGYVIKCDKCDISMTYHIGDTSGILRCHYCGSVLPIPKTCPSCGSSAIRFFGAGTQKVEEEIGKLFPSVSAVRMDLDTTSGKDGHGKILEEFRSGRARILIGTQMIAKGHDFPGVTLVGIIAADGTLNLPDYRSRERTFQLLTQAAGRAGRGEKAGRVIIQTYHPEDTVLQYAAKQDYRSFYEYEFGRRRAALYPPFTSIARFLAESTTEGDEKKEIDHLEKSVLKLIEQNPLWKRRILLVLNESPSVRMLRGKYRHCLLLKLIAGGETEKICAALSELSGSRITGSDVWFEVDPVNMI